MGVMHNNPLAFQCTSIYGRSYEDGEKGDGKEGVRFLGRERVEINWPLVCR